MADLITPGLGSVIGAGISAGGGLFGGLIGQGGQQATNAQQMAMFQEAERFNENAAWENRAWEQQMSSTAYQRSMDDMKKAGLNPILAANLGGASTPGAGAASIGTGPALGNPGSALQAGITSAADAGAKAAMIKSVMTQADKDQSQVDLNKATEGLTNKQSVRTEQETATSKSAENLNNATIINKAAEAILMHANANSANAQARATTISADQSEQFGDSPWSKAIAGIVKMIGTGGRLIPNSAGSAVPVGTPTGILGGPAAGQPGSVFNKYIKGQK